MCVSIYLPFHIIHIFLFIYFTFLCILIFTYLFYELIYMYSPIYLPTCVPAYVSIHLFVYLYYHSIYQKPTHRLTYYPTIKLLYLITAYHIYQTQDITITLNYYIISQLTIPHHTPHYHTIYHTSTTLQNHPQPHPQLQPHPQPYHHKKIRFGHYNRPCQSLTTFDQFA